jgi:hypothetical protein
VGDLPALGEGTLLFSVVLADPLPEGVAEISNIAAIIDDGSQGIDPVIENNWASIVLVLGSGGADDPDEEVCHPVAHKIADSVNLLTSDNSSYTCEDILDMFNGSLTEAQLGFGRMLRAYSLAAGQINLPWETILQWHLDGNGWGTLMQLNRLAGETEGYSLEELMDLLDSEIRVFLIRFALRLVEKYDADLDTALDRLIEESEGRGTAIQVFRTAQETGLSAEDIQLLLDEGYKLSEIRQAARLAEGDMELLQQILQIGIAEYRQSQNEPQGNDNQTQQQDRQNERTASQIAERYEVTPEQVMGVFNAECQGNWPCVREYFRENYEKPRGNNKN